jgi:hypothetical protein
VGHILGTENFFRGNLSDGEPLQYQQEDFDFWLDVYFFAFVVEKS